MAKLGVNIDHVATIRQARGGAEPDPVTAAVIAELAGADGITIHLREDRRHIQDRDLELLRKTIKTRLNLEMAATDEMVLIAQRVRPDMCTLVPEKRLELTTEGGLDVRCNMEQIKSAVEQIRSAGIPVSLFIDADPDQIKAADRVGADFIEIHTGIFSEATDWKIEFRTNLDMLALVDGFNQEQVRRGGVVIRIGIGIAWISPMGPLKLSYAYPIHNQPGDRLQRFQFQIGTGF